MTVNLLFPHQLFHDHEFHKNGFLTYLIEEYLFFQQYNFHKQKIAYHRASMQAYLAVMKKKKNKVHYIDSTDPRNDIRQLIKDLAKNDVKEIHFVNPTDYLLERRLRAAVKKHNIKLVEYENELFINAREDLKTFFKPDKKSFFQTTFYKQQRKKQDILIEGNDQPVGGKWSFDADNRKKYPKGKTPPAITFPKKDKYWKEAVSYVEKHFSDNIGILSKEPLYPYTRTETDKWLQQFFEFRFHQFGDYEDAILAKASILHHSVLTPMMNIGLIAPMEVVNRALIYAEENQVPINSLEGFVRQIIGWREFIRGMYEAKGTESRTRNFWGFERKIPTSFYDGTTGIIPVDDTIKKVLRDGYCHHVERLMVLGNFMLLCEFHPDEVYRWFMEVFIDAYDWVMVPNVYGMSQFADGGFFATKPYISGSNYIMKMSDYKKGDWQQTWDGLFWRFMNNNRDFFLKNPRLGMLVRTFDKMNLERKEMLLKTAEDFLDRMDER
jgi:deoxyribodipyrimidine photolyase-related protein